MVGDLHGHRGLLEQALERQAFDPRLDRVLSVGDLVDRGPDSLSTLALIEEPWFHAVLGNHELMLLNFLGYYGSRLHSRKAYASGSGAWAADAISRNPKLLGRLADRVAAMPLALHVDGEVPFNVMHGDLDPIGSRQAVLLDEKSLCAHRADAATSSRAKIGCALKRDLLGLSFGSHPVQISEAPLGELPITYVGHTPHPHILVHDSYVYVDQGVCAQTSRRAPATLPTVLDHRKFAYWLNGVAIARARSGTSAPRRPWTPFGAGSLAAPV